MSGKARGEGQSTPISIFLEDRPLRDRIRATLIALAATFGLLVSAVPVHAATPPPKVVIIVGPTGSITDSYRRQADQTATAAEAAGAVVTKVYSPNATWANVKAAVNGANVIVYYGHGNGFPSPYSTTFSPEKVDGWGLNRTTTNGDGDSWSSTMVYCGEAALTGGPLPAGSPQAAYCSGGPITPAPGWVMVYANACYAPGASEPGKTPATPTQALQRVSYFSRPILAGLGASGYFATDHGAASLVAAILANPDTAYGDLYAANLPSGLTVGDEAHLFVSGRSGLPRQGHVRPVLHLRVRRRSDPDLRGRIRAALQQPDSVHRRLRLDVHQRHRVALRLGDHQGLLRHALLPGRHGDPRPDGRLPRPCPLPSGHGHRLLH